jgi:hypothetical protein
MEKAPIISLTPTANATDWIPSKFVMKIAVELRSTAVSPSYHCLPPFNSKGQGLSQSLLAVKKLPALPQRLPMWSHWVMNSQWSLLDPNFWRVLG